jgi:hypothetical protein
MLKEMKKSKEIREVKQTFDPCSLTLATCRENPSSPVKLSKELGVRLFFITRILL